MKQNTAYRKLEPGPSYLILVQPMLVAVDISQAIADFVPRALVIIVQCAEEAGEALRLAKNIHVAFLGLAPDSDKGWHLAEAVRAQRGRVVFIGDEAEDRGPRPDCMVLHRPFDTDAVWAAIKGVSNARADAASRLIGMAYPSTRHHGAPVTTSPFAQGAHGQVPTGNRFDIANEM